MELILKGDPSEKQLRFLLSQKRHVAYGGSRGGGKAQPLDAKIYKTDGSYILMGNIKVGDIIADSNGNPQTVLEIHPQGLCIIAKIMLTDGRETTATLDHLWLVRINGEDVLMNTTDFLISMSEPQIPYQDFIGGEIKYRHLLNYNLYSDVECQCITVSNPNGLYITDNFIVTHNSWSLRRKMILRRLLYEKTKGLILRRTYPELYTNHVIPLMEDLKGIAKYSSEHKVFTFPNDSMLFLGYCDSEADVLRYQGQEYEDIALDEATHFTEYQVNMIKLSNRTINNKIEPRMYYTANPGNVGHAWFKRLFIDRIYFHNENPEDYEFIQASVYDNKYIMDNDPMYVKHLESLPEIERKIMLEGNWDVFAGQFFKEFDRQRHVIKPFKIPDWWERIVSVDWGYNDPCAIYWHAMGDDGHLYTYRELYVTQHLASQVAELILRYPDFSYCVLSRDAWAKRGTGAGESVAEELMTAGIPLREADNNRILGWARMREWLAIAPDNKPFWQIFDTCDNLIRTLPLAMHDDHRVEDVSGKADDHAIESVRYAMMSRPPVSVMPMMKAEVDEDDEIQERTLY